ncbi:hypothetical protein DEO72_LG5g2544 [Vigna unguiculata]|uniref:Uncharacterized protein n=1 Tax=Vigna unguiculata TaxID=3917 RepID=A0A4D6M0X4_VIGUN|nr:hypothetical protein DEO72_LG5g2544 [Vigna unguiculata]
MEGRRSDLEKEWTEKLQNVNPPEMDEIHMQCIYRVPSNIRNYNPNAYTPQVVSIGPYHHNSFETMEELKLKYVKGFLNRTRLSTKEFVAKIEEIENSNNIRSCYADPIKCNGDDFFNMILVDACFMIELFLRWHERSDWEGKDPLMLKPWMLLQIRNMMAYEHCHDSATKIITQYVAILDFLINTEKDVNILVDKKIIVNWLGDTDKVVTMISNLNSTVTMPEFCSHYFSVCNGLNKFYENPRNKYKAMLIHDYLNTPWKIASTVAAIVLLLLTLIQTVIEERIH